MATKTLKKDDSPKVMDLRRPNSVKPVATSKPVIVGHRNEVIDPMVMQASSQTDDPKIKAKPVTPITIVDNTAPSDQSLSADIADKITDFSIEDALEQEETIAQPAPSSEKTEVVRAKDVMPPPEEPAAEHKPEDDSQDLAASNTSGTEPVSDSDDQPEKGAEPAPEPATAEDPDEEPVSGSADTNDTTSSDTAKPDEKPEDAAAAEAAKIKALVDSKKYFLPIKKSRAKATHGVSPIVGLLVVVLLLGGLYVALDGQVIKNSLNLPVHLFKNVKRP